MDWQLLWQVLSKLGLARPVDRWRESRTKSRHAVCAHTLEKSSPTAILWDPTICVRFWSTSFSALNSLWCIVLVAVRHGFFPTDKKPFINFVLSLFSQPLTLDGRWSYFNGKQDVIRLNSENLFYLKETNRTVSPMAALNKGKKKKIINAGSYLHLKTPNLCEFWSFLSIWTYFTRWQRR